MTSILEFIAGIGLFLFAMKQLESNLKQFAGKRLQLELSNRTGTKLEAIATGTIATALLQSSSLVGLIVIALCGAGLLPLLNAIGVMLGANLGTTLTGWLVTLVGFKLNLGDFALYIIGFSGLLNILLSNKKLTYFFAILISFGLLLIGLDLMKSSASGIAEQIDIQAFRAHSTFYFLVLGVLLSAVIQSSSAVMLITLSALNIQVFELHHAAALIIGADLGTTSTVIIGSLKGATIKRQLALSHFIFNLITNLIAFIVLLPFIYPIMNYFDVTDPLYSLVLFHSLFNLMGILIFFPWLKTFSTQIKQRITTEPKQYTQYIYKVPAELVSIALPALKKEVNSLLNSTLNANQNALSSKSSDLLENYKHFKHIEGEIIRYVKTIQQQKLTPSESESLNQLARATRHAIFSQKSLIDITDDIQNIYLANRDTQKLALTSEFFTLFEQSSRSMQQLINQTKDNLELQDNQNWHETIDNMRVDLKLHYLRNQDKLYEQQTEPSFTGIEISSLLNLNKEIYTSSTNSIKAVESYLSNNKN